MTRNIVVGEALWVFEQNNRDRVTETNASYKLVMKYLISHFFPPKALQIQKRYLQRGLYKPRGTKIQEFVSQIDKMVEYLEKFLPLGIYQGLPNNNILDFVELSLPR